MFSSVGFSNRFDNIQNKIFYKHTPGADPAIFHAIIKTVGVCCCWYVCMCRKYLCVDSGFADVKLVSNNRSGREVSGVVNNITSTL